MVDIRLDPTAVLKTGKVEASISLHHKAKMSAQLMLKKQTDKIILRTEKMKQRQEEVKALKRLLTGAEKYKSEGLQPLIYLDSMDKPSGANIKQALSKVELFKLLKKDEWWSEKQSRPSAVLTDEFLKKVEKRIVDHSKPMEEEQVLLKEAIAQYDKIDRLGIKILKISADLNLNIIKSISA